MTSFHVANFEFRDRLQDYLLTHGLSDKLNLDKVIDLIESEDVKQILVEVRKHPTTQEQFFDAFHHHRKQLRDHLFKYFDRTHADVILYPSVSI